MSGAVVETVETAPHSKGATDPKLKLGRMRRDSVQVSFTLATGVIDVNHLEVGVKIQRG